MNEPQDAEDMVREMLQLNDCGHTYRSAVEALLGLVEGLRAELSGWQKSATNQACMLDAAEEECDRLRAENAVMSADVGDLRHTLNTERIENVELHNRIGKLEAENTELRAEVQSQRSIWNMTGTSITAELEWFRRREQVMQRHPLGFIPNGWADWLRNNPKPGAGT